MNADSYIAIIGAKDEEIDEYSKHLHNLSATKWHDYVFLTGDLFGKKVVLTETGIGKVHAALITQKVIDEYKPTALIFTGLAGGLNNEFEIGDILVSNDLIQHDFRAHPQFPKYTIPKSNGKDTFHIFLPDKDLKERALSYKTTAHKVRAGRILTGDQFLSRSEMNKYAHLIEELHGDAVEMEGAAVAQVCTINQLPFVVIRTISDKADNNANVDFKAFLPIAAKNSIGMVRHILESLSV